jgi:YidC/Oxa1 family membrane protein insertase
MGFFEIFAAALSGFYAVIPSYGVAIILLTLTVRILILPLSIKQTRSMREMQVIQPELKKLQAKFKGNRQKLNEATMALYKEHNVNPFGGCLPLVAQFPVLIGLFYVIRRPLEYLNANTALAVGLRDVPEKVNSFLGLSLNCSSASVIDKAPECGSGFVAALPYLVLVALMGFTTYYSQKQMQARQGAQQPQQMQMFMRILPVMLMFFAFSFPTGVVIYWLTTNVWQIVQQRIMLMAVPPVPAGKKPADTSGDGGGDAKTKGISRSTKSGSKPRGSTDDGQKKPPSNAPSRSHPSRRKKKKR